MSVLASKTSVVSCLDGLSEAGVDVLYEPDAKGDAVAKRIGGSGAEVLVVRSAKVTLPMLEAERLSLVVRGGAGYNTIGVDAASERGIYSICARSWLSVRPVHATNNSPRPDAAGPPPPEPGIAIVHQHVPAGSPTSWNQKENFLTNT